MYADLQCFLIVHGLLNFKEQGGEKISGCGSNGLFGEVENIFMLFLSELGVGTTQQGNEEPQGRYLHNTGCSEEGIRNVLMF